MGLPKIDSPVYELDLPLSKKHIRFRPFLVKEQKNLLMAFEADDADTINNNIRQVLINCTIDGKIDIDNLPIVDVEYYFLQLRARSVSEIVDATYRCNNEVNDEECGNAMKTKINILEMKVEKDESIKDIIQLTDSISVKLKYPPFSAIRKAANTDNITDLAFEMIMDSIDVIYDGQQSYLAKDYSREELTEFLESLNQQQFKKIEYFFENLPKLNKQFTLKCSKCGFDHDLYYEGLESFFD
jgi:hypothetical protein